ncbi:phage tail spike protein [Macrococcoides goetzii]|uniref:phage tail spike protein n=1 Tax=Macrococcus sp. PK TaxID=2801919 RepID=UPI001F112772|nr:phage tail spike protein [Macrococcus sp. PK]
MNEDPKYIWDYRKSDNLMKSSTLDKELEAVDQFNFELIDSDIKLKSFVSFVEVKNEVKNNVVFRGRIMTPTTQMNEDGTYNTSYTSEGAMAYLDDFIPSSDMKTDLTPQQRFTELINIHNSLLGADTYKRINIGTVSVTPKIPESETAEYDDTAYFILDPEKSILTHIRELILGVYGGEIVLRYEADGNYIDWVDKIGSKKSTELKVGKNMKSFQRQIDPTEVITRLIPLGSSEPTAWEGSKRLEIIEDPRSGGKNYIDIPELIALYGIQTGVAIFDDEYTPDTLYDRGMKEKIEIMKKYAKMTTEIQLLDLFTIGLDPDDFERGNFYHTILPRYSIDEDLRVVGTSFDVIHPQNKSCRIGDKDLGILDVSDINTLNIINEAVPPMLDKTVSEIRQEIESAESEAVKSADDLARQRVEQFKRDSFEPFKLSIPDVMNTKLSDFKKGELGTIINNTITTNGQSITNDVVNKINSSTNVIRSDAIVVDAAMINKIAADQTFTDKLVATDAFIRNIMASNIVSEKIKATDIDASQLNLYSIADGTGKIPGAITITRPDGAKSVINGLQQFGLSIWRYHPQFVNSKVNISGVYFTTTSTDLVTFDAFAFKHDSRFVKIRLEAYTSSSNGYGILNVEGFSGTNFQRGLTIWGSEKQTYELVIDAGIPTGELKYFYLRFSSYSASYTMNAREIIIYQEG